MYCYAQERGKGSCCRRSGRRSRRRKSRRKSRGGIALPLVVVGLGNPGKTYAGTRHNVGFRVIHVIAETLSIKLKKPFFYSYLRGRGIYQDKDIILAKPLTFMNRSGVVISSILHYAKAEISDLLILCDSMDLDVGICRLKTKGSSAGHRGLRSVIDYAGTQNIMRLYIGIGRPEDDAVIEYVLGRPGEDEKQKLEDAIQKVASGVLMLLEKSPAEVMNIINRKTNN